MKFNKIFNKNIALLKIFTVIFFILLFLIPILLHYFDKDNIVLFLLKDGSVYENIGALSALLSSLIFFYLFKRNPKYYFFLILGLLLLFLFGEEISWGQQFFNYNSPKFFLENNYQKEITIHNLKFFHNENIAVFDLGKYLIIVYFVFLTLLSKIFFSFNKVLNRIHVPIASLLVAFLVLLSREMNTIVNKIFQISPSLPDILRIGEIFETSLEIIILYFSLEMYYKYTKSKSRNSETSVLPKKS